MDGQAAVGFAAAPAIVWGVLEALKFLIDRFLVPDAKRLVAIGLGVGYSLAAWSGGILEADNAMVAGLMGITIGLGAMGFNEITGRVRRH